MLFVVPQTRISLLGEQNMYTRKLDKDIRSPLEYGLSVFGGKWKPRIIGIIAAKGTLRYSSIRDEMGNITDAMLATTLKELIADEMIVRHQFDEIPPRVEYQLTDKGQSVVPILQTICKWAGEYCEEGKCSLPQCQDCIYHP